jgi:cyclopropane fatty-acyl-phospholipid synthase-like methyltransferase
MSKLRGNYKNWASIDYQPFIAELHPNIVLSQLSSGASALEVGCNRGGTSLFLASNKVNVLGLDLNGAAVEEARSRAIDRGLEATARFEIADFLVNPPSQEYDLVLLIRVLTCFPDEREWRALLSQAKRNVRPGGLLYIHDFLISRESENYRVRYEAGAKRGWRFGNFSVSSPAGDALFVARHHSDEEVRSIISPYSPISYSIHDSLSMNGNQCRMFEFLGRRIA